MKRLSFLTLLSLGLCSASFFITSCQKEASLDTTDRPTLGDVAIGDRSPNKITYGVTLYDGVNPCEIVAMDQGTGNVIPAPVTAFYIDNAGNVIKLDNLKGICLTEWGQYFLTTGNPANPTLGPASVYNNALFKVNPNTGQCSFASASGVGTVSDLEYNPGNQHFYGLRGNSNAIIEIVDNANNYGTYNGPFAITGIANGYTLKGLSLVRDFSGQYLVGCATSANTNQPAKMYQVPLNGGAATFITDLDPVGELGGGHCGIGFDRDLNNMLVNRTAPSPTFVLGLNEFAWNPLFPPVTPTTFWGGANYIFEDLTSSVY